MKAFWIDTNVIVRFLVDDHDEHSPAAKEIIQRAQNSELRLHLNPIVVGECYRILWKVYHNSKKEVANTLDNLFSHPAFVAHDKELILESLRNSAINSRLSYEDAYIAGTAKRHPERKILIFNTRDFDKLRADHYAPLDLSK